MPIPLPQLDNLSFEELVDEARSLIPSLSPSWTDHNASDPGMTLIELFAWMSEMLIYRSDQVTPEHQRTFLRLLNGLESDSAEETDSAEEQRQLDQEIAQTVVGLRERYRTVTTEDYEIISLEASNKIARSKCVARRNLDGATETLRAQTAPAHVSIMILPVQAFDYILPAFEQRELFITTDEYIYLGLREQIFDAIQIELSQAGQGYQLQYEYHDGSDWLPLPEYHDGSDWLPSQERPLDTTFQWQRDGIVRLGEVANWALSSPDEVSTLIPEGEVVEAAYWLRVHSAVPSASRPNAIAVDIFPRVLQPSPDLISTLESDLEPRRLLATHNHVVGPIYTPVGGTIILAAREDVVPEVLRQEILSVLTRYLDPLLGGSEGLGWPFGRDIYVSEFYGLLESLADVDYIGEIELSSLSSIAPRTVEVAPYWHDDGEMIGLRLQDHHLPKANFNLGNIIVASQLIPLSIELSGIAIVDDLTEIVLLRELKQAIKRYFRPRSDGPSESWQNDNWQVNDSDIASMLATEFGDSLDLENLRIDLYGPTAEEDPTREHRYIAEFTPGQLADIRLITDDLLA